MPELLFYRKIIGLDKHLHRELRVGTLKDFRFSSAVNSVPLAGIEFIDAAREYPIVFSGKSAATPVVPLALLGLRNNENLFLEKNGKWNAHYVPAFIRRYPFVLGNAGNEQLMVCIDEGHPIVGDPRGERLFDDQGNPTPFLSHAMKFLSDYQAEVHRTRAFIGRLTELDLLTEVSARAELKTGKAHQLNGLYVVNEAKYRALEGETVLELFRNGWMALIDAHLLSLGNLGRLMDRLAKT